MPVIPALGKLKQEDNDFEVSLSYIVKPCLNNKTNKKRQKRKKGVGRKERREKKGGRKEGKEGRKRVF
jgi:hypothetical protein